MASATAQEGANAWPGWDIEVLHDLGAPTSKENRLFLYLWQAYEHSNARYNPLNLTAPKGNGAINSDGVQNYPSPALGARYTAQNISSGQYPAIYKMLKSNSVSNVLGGHGLSDVAGELRHWGSNTFADSLTGKVDQAGPIRPAINAVEAPFKDIASFFSWVAGNWDRILWVMGGGILVLIALIMLFKSQSKSTVRVERG